VLEYARITMTFNEEENMMYSDAIGQVVQNGVSLNETLASDEAFGYQLMNGKPFYFFERDGEIGFSFDGEETVLGFDSIPHYACCSAAELNPRHALNMVAFFAERDGRWYYVEIGVYD
jgi:hypothetical protein